MPAGNHEGKALSTWLVLGVQMAFTHLLWTLELTKVVNAIGGTEQNLVREGHGSWGGDEILVAQYPNIGACHSHGPKPSVTAFTDQGKALAPKGSGEVIPARRSA